MTLHITRHIPRADWNDALARLPHAHVLQTWEWGDLKARHSWQPERLLWHEQGRPCAAASVLVRRVGRWPAALAYVPKGPALDYREGALLERVLADLEEEGRRKGALFVKIDPDVAVDGEEGEEAVDVLRRRGWRVSREQVQFRNTVCVDLRPDPEALLARMKLKWRYNVRLAARKGVAVRLGTQDDLATLYRMYAETAARDRFVIRPPAYYQDVWSTFLEAGMAQPLIAEASGEPIAMVILFCFAGRAWYMYGASQDAHRERMPNYLLQWEAMRWAREQGCTVYDMWGAPEVPDEPDPLWGVYCFKQGFGGDLVRHIGAWDFPVSGPAHRLYTRARPLLLAYLHWLHWRRSAQSASPGFVLRPTFSIASS